ncbi:MULTISPECIES: hypothetical protein [Ruminococcus]|uniref:Uncharacterized protein n=1 Tax=Ruminococcus flavefaciens TaxID=1265 RepID=A0A1M7KAX3_RUMFL|nr:MULTISPECIES: hypothetical protein [Ruminococcus]MCR4795556.1 hypothetical protein [Ruminococcus sp.]SHM62420.1 hypothetical protein SAMN04487860_10815 [Ruminococcus flavefaciens]
MGLCIPLAIFLTFDLLDILTREYLVWGLWIFEAALLFILPIRILREEKRIPVKAPMKLSSVMFLCGYAAAVIAALIIQATIENVDLAEKLLPHGFLSGIGLTVICMILAGGFFWAVIFRVAVAIARFSRGARK